MRAIMIFTGLIFLFGQEPLLFAGRVELTTYYPAPYGEYKSLNATDSTSATTTPLVLTKHLWNTHRSEIRWPCFSG